MSDEIKIVKVKCIKLHEKQGKSGKQYYELETDNGNITFFDGGLADLIEKRGVIGKICELGLKENKGYQNLYSVEKVFDTFQTADKADFYKQTGLKEKFGRTPEEKNSIVAQCIIKVAAELTKSQIEVLAGKNAIVDLDTEMSNNTKIALDCYKKVVEELNNGN